MVNVSLEHEAPLEVLREAPSVLRDLLRLAGRKVRGAGVPTIIASELKEAIPLSLEADLVAVTPGADGDVLIVEVQRRRDDDKLRAWPLYVAHLTARHKKRVELLVLTFNTATTRWAAKARFVGPNMMFAPTVLGPDSFPTVRAKAQALQHPELAVFAALARLDGRAWSKLQPAKQAEVLLICEAFAESDKKQLKETYLSLIDAAGDREFRATLRTLLERHAMTLRELILEVGKAEGKTEGKLEGKLEGKAEALLRVLRKRGLLLDAAIEQRVLRASVAELDAWLDRAVDATRLTDVFAD